jgi:hypothetical protein
MKKNRSSGAQPPQLNRTPRETPTRFGGLFNAATGLSERRPYNIVKVGPFWIRQWISRHWYYSRFRFWQQHKYRLDEGGAVFLGMDAEPIVRGYFNSQAMAMLEQLKAGRDMSYVRVRGLPTVGDFSDTQATN